MTMPGMFIMKHMTIEYYQISQNPYEKKITFRWKKIDK